MSSFMHLDPQTIRIFDFDLSPREPDDLVVQEDLDRFVQKTRTIRATPKVVIAGDRVFAVNGAPYIRAAQRATPPIAAIKCYLRSTPMAMPGISDKVSVFGEDRASAPNVQMLAFGRQLTETERRAVERLIRVGDTNAGTTKDSSEVEDFEWSGPSDHVFWSAIYHHAPSNMRLLPHQAFKQIDSDIAPVRSWNGMDFGWYRKFKWDSFFGQTDRIEFPNRASFRTEIYSVSHCSLLLRAAKADDGRNIDLMFAGVDYWQMAHRYDELSLRLPTEDELAFLKRHTKKLDEHRVTVMQANGGERYLVVAAFRWIERNRYSYSETSLFE